MSAEAYFEATSTGLEKLRDEQLANIKAAADLLADTIEAGNAIFAFGATHSFILAMEMVYRTGGLMLINTIYPHGMDLSVRPMPLTSQIERLPRLDLQPQPQQHARCLGHPRLLSRLLAARCLVGRLRRPRRARWGHGQGRGQLRRCATWRRRRGRRAGIWRHDLHAADLTPVQLS